MENRVKPYEKEILRELGRQVTEIGNLPHFAKKKKLWAALNKLQPERPMVLIDQVCWNEMNVDDELTLRTEHPVCREYETFLRRAIYGYRHMPVDMVVEPYVTVPKRMLGFQAGFADWQGRFDFGIEMQEETSVLDVGNEVVGHKYIGQIESEDDLEKIKMPNIIYLPDETARALEFVQDLFGDSIEVRLQGCFPGYKVWDTLIQWCGVEESLLNMIAEPEFSHKLADRLTRAHLEGLDQLENLGLLGRNQTLVHCTGAYSDELDMDKDDTRAKDLWTFNLCQIFSSVSPAMHKEYEADYSRKWFSRFGLGYYGCCEPLHDRIDMIRTIPNIRKISMSPWADCAAGAEAMGKDYVFSRKPMPAVFAEDSFDLNKIRKELEAVIEICGRTGTPLEIIQKDVSTLRYQPQRLWEWAKMASEIVGAE